MTVREAPRWVRLVICLQFGVPGALLLTRLVTGEIRFYGLGWQMFSG